MGGGLIVDGHELCDLRATVAELGSRTARLDDCHADPEGRYLLRDGLHEDFNAPLCGVIHRIPREGDLPAVGRNLDDASAALSAKVRQRGTDQMDRPDQVRRDDVLDLLVCEFLRGAKQAVTGVADDHVDPSVLRERAFDKISDRRCVGHVEHLGMECLGITFDQIGDFSGVADGSDNAVAAVEELIGEVATEAAADPSDEPCALWHCEFSYSCFNGQCAG